MCSQALIRCGDQVVAVFIIYGTVDLTTVSMRNREDVSECRLHDAESTSGYTASRRGRTPGVQGSRTESVYFGSRSYSERETGRRQTLSRQKPPTLLHEARSGKQIATGHRG